MSGTMPNIVLDNGKYTIVLKDDGAVEKVLHHRPTDNDLLYTKVFTSLVYAYVDLRARTIRDDHLLTRAEAEATAKDTLGRNADEASPREDGTDRKAHYGRGEQPWDVIRRLSWAPAFAAGNVLKYLRRTKDPEHSLESARWYYAELRRGAAEIGGWWSDAYTTLHEELTRDECQKLQVRIR